MVSALAQTQVNGALDKEYCTHATHTWQRLDVVEFTKRLCGPTEIHLTVSGVEQALSGCEVEGTSSEHDDADSWVLVDES